MKTVTVFWNKFGGVINDPRQEGSGCRMVTNFDIITNPNKLTPYRNSESGNSGQSDNKVQNFCIAEQSAGSYTLYGLGVVTGTGRVRVLKKEALTTGGANDLDDSGWGESANNASASGSTNFNLFVFYKKTGLIYGAKAGTTIWSYDPTGSAAFGDSHRSISYTNIAQGLVHSKDDILYIPYDNKIASNNNGSWTDAALTLPTHLYITSICEYGNYLAIACAPLSGIGNSVVYLWDRDSTLVTLSETIDWGEGVIKVIEEIEGFLVGISIIGNTTTRFKPRVTFKYYNGGRATLFQTLEHDNASTIVQLALAKQKINERLYFMMSLYKNGALREGVWSVGKGVSGLEIVHERTPNNDTALTDAATLKGFIFVGDFLFQSYLETNYGMSKTNDSEAYATSILETKINPGVPHSDKSQVMQLMAVGAMYEALPASGQVIVKHRIQGGTYKTVFTETADSQTYTEPTTNYNTDGEQFNVSKENEFRIESTGGAIVTGLVFKYRVKETNA